MSRLARDLAEAADPVLLARRLGWEPDAWQAEALRARDQYRLLNCHRQGGKSTVAAVRGLHCALHEPGSLVVIVSPTMRQSTELFRTVSAYWRALGKPVSAEVENVRSVELANRSRILCLPGDPDTVRGLAAVRLLIVDEASRVGDDVWAAVSPMVAISGGQVLALSTPWGMRGWWYRAATGDDNRWAVTTVPATECPRLSAEYLEQERRDLGDLIFESEYLCRFSANAAGVFAGADIDRAFRRFDAPFDPQAPLRSAVDRLLPEGSS